MERGELTPLRRWVLRSLAAGALALLVVIGLFSRWRYRYSFKIEDGFGLLDTVGLFVIALVAVVAIERLRRR